MKIFGVEAEGSWLGMGKFCDGSSEYLNVLAGFAVAFAVGKLIAVLVKNPQSNGAGM